MNFFPQPIAEALFVCRNKNALSYSPAYRILRMHIFKGVPHFKPTSRISMLLINTNGKRQSRPLVPCEWLVHRRLCLALCPNPYPLHPNDQYLLLDDRGIACYSAPTPEIARIHFYFITGRLNTAAHNSK